MLAFISSCGLSGIDGFAVDVEVNLAHGMPMFEIVGLPDASVKESRERVRAALKNSGYAFPAERLTVNLSMSFSPGESDVSSGTSASAISSCSGTSFASTLTPGIVKINDTVQTAAINFFHLFIILLTSTGKIYRLMFTRLYGLFHFITKSSRRNPPTRSSHREHSALRALCSCTRQELTRALKD